MDGLLDLADGKAWLRAGGYAPGDGDIPIARILGQVLDAGYRGCFDLELIGPAIEDEGYEHAVPRAITAFDELLASLPAGR